MRRKKYGRLAAAISLMFLLYASVLPWVIFAADKGEVTKTPPPEAPYERVVYQQGNWHSEYIRNDDKTNLIVSYNGSWDIKDEPKTDGEQLLTMGQKSLIKFSLKTKIVLKGVYLPFAYPAVNPQLKIISFYLSDSRSNIYGPFDTLPVKTYTDDQAVIYPQNSAAQDGGTVSILEKVPGDESFDKIYYNNIFITDSVIVLPPGEYTLHTNDDGRMVRNAGTAYKGAVLIKGVNYSAWQSYQDKLLQWRIANDPELAAVATMGQTGDELAVTVEGSKVLSEAREAPESYQIPVAPPAVSAQKPPAVISLQQSSLIREIVFNTYNGGKGAAPGVITITDKKGQVQGKYQAYGGMLGDTANGMWVAGPDVVLPAGEYTVSCSDMAAVTYNEKGTPDFYIAMVPMLPAQYDFTGRYRINLDAVKTSTLMGPVKDGKSSFSLKDFELTVLDQGETLELIGKYEGMPFSQTCGVTERAENSLKAQFAFNADLSNLPYKAKIGATCLVTFHKPPGLQPKLELQGQAVYERAASKEKGADYNTYKIAGGGSMAAQDLPAYVVAALGARGISAGNIPGPDGPAQAAAGILFPPLAGLVVHVLQELLKPKPKAGEKHRELSVGEKAMADANRSLGKGLYTEEEAKAWTMVADALGASGGDAEDAVSIGDNEKPGGADYIAPGGDGSGGGYGGEDGYTEEDYEEPGFEESEGSAGEDTETVESETAGPADHNTAEQVFGSEREKLEAERDEWLANLESSRESADPNDPRSQELHQQYKDYIDHLDGKINDLIAAEKAASWKRMTVQVDHTGRTAEIAYDPETDTWMNMDSGSEFKMESYIKDVAPGFAKTKEFIEAQRYKQETRDTDFDRAMDALVADNKERERLLGQLQKIRNKSYGIVPPAEGVGDVQANIDKLINDLSNRELPTGELQDKAVRSAKVVTGRTTGRTMSEEDAQRLTEREMSYTHAAAQTVAEGWKDVITGRTKAGMAGRIALAGLTGGASEYVLSPVEALMDIKESMDNGESGTRATLKAMGKYALGELGGEYMGEAWKRSGYSINPDLVRKASELGNTPVSKIYKEYLGQGTEAGSKQALEGLSASAGKRALGGADSQIGKTASDLSEYAKYRTDVKNQANIIESKIRNAAPNRPLTAEDVNKALGSDDIRKVLRDPSVSRELKNMNPGVQKAYQDALDGKLYNPAKNNTAQQLKDNLLSDVRKEFGPDARISKVEVDSIRTPGAKSSPINADNDLTGKITITDGKGRTITREIPADQVAPVYNEKFAEASGMLKDGKFNVEKARAEMPEGITITDANGKTRTIDWGEATKEQQLEAFTKKHNQEITDVHSAEASVDFNAARNADGISNVGKLKAGDPSAALADPGGLAKMEQYKINNYFNKGGVANQTEAYEQLTKMGKLTNDLTGAYQKLGYNAPSLPGNMQRALEVVSDRGLSPGVRTIELQKLGFDGPGDLANKLSGRIEGLQKLGRPKAGQTDNPMLKKISSIIIGSYLNDENK